MREYVGLLEMWQNDDDTALWVAKAYSYVAGLPPKALNPAPINKCRAGARTSGARDDGEVLIGKASG